MKPPTWVICGARGRAHVGEERKGRDRWGGLSEEFSQRPGTEGKSGRVDQAFLEFPWLQRLQSICVHRDLYAHGVFHVHEALGGLGGLGGLHVQEALQGVHGKEDGMQGPYEEQAVYSWVQ